MFRVRWPAVLGPALAVWLAISSTAQAQPRPYIGYAYPAGGQQGTTFQVRLGGQGPDNVRQGAHFRHGGQGQGPRVSPTAESSGDPAPEGADQGTEEARQPPDRLAAIGQGGKNSSSLRGSRSVSPILCQPRPAPRSRASCWWRSRWPATRHPHPRELRLVTPRGVSNPLQFHVGQFAEVSRKPMKSAPLQVLGKEELALRKRPADEVEQQITLPCTVNGQVASGEVNRYRFTARKGQRLVISTAARQLIPYIADAVPGWFQPVLALYDASGKELAYDDDYRFKPDPLILFEVPRDGEYCFTITDAIYRGREDFVYRVTIGELPFVTSIFPLGSRAGTPVAIGMKGWNLDGAELTQPASDAEPGTYFLEARKQGLVSNRVPFALDDTAGKHRRQNPTTTGRLRSKSSFRSSSTDGSTARVMWMCTQFTGRAGETVVAEITARRLDSSLDSFIKLTGPDGKLLAFNDDREDPGSGLNTHHADSYVMARLPAEGSTT